MWKNGEKSVLWRLTTEMTDQAAPSIREHLLGHRHPNFKRLELLRLKVGKGPELLRGEQVRSLQLNALVQALLCLESGIKLLRRG